jgi:hypothetical protein
VKKRLALAIGVAAVFAALIAPAAHADHHLVKIREVHNGSDPGTTGDYVMLEMYSPGENLFLNHYISFRDATGMAAGDHIINVNGAGTADQSTFIVGNTPNADDSSVGDQFVNGAGGAVCYEESGGELGGLDCVSWGAFTGSTLAPSSPTGTPALPIPPGGSLIRSISAGCSTLLEPGDDTNNSAADFALGTPIGHNSHVAPTDHACTGTPVKKCKKGKKLKTIKKHGKKIKKCVKKKKHHKK